MLARTRATDTSLRKLLRLQVGRRPRPFPSTPVLTGTGIRKRLRSSFAACRFHQQVCSPVPQIVRSRSVQLYLCQAQPTPALDLTALAARFAPQRRFDPDAVTPRLVRPADPKAGVPNAYEDRCLPSNAETYYQQHIKHGVADEKLCNTDAKSLSNSSIPTYYVAGQVGPESALIRYWFFYARDVGHTADWESMMVLISGNQLARVVYFMHKSHVTRAPGAFEVVDGTHPVGYVGRDHHATYFDTGGTFGDFTFDDFRHPSSFKLDTRTRIVPIQRGEGAEEWMNCDTDQCFGDVVKHPLKQTGAMPSQSECHVQDAREKSCGGFGLSESAPFMRDPSEAPYYRYLRVERSGKVLDVPNASQKPNTDVDQFGNYQKDQER